MRRSGFTLIELLTVMAILSILYAIAVPAFVAGKAAVINSVAINGLKQLGECTNMYVADSDDVAPLAMYESGPMGLITWFGAQTGPGVFDSNSGLISPYDKGHVSKDLSFHGSPWIGDDAGYGYNWGYIGSDFNMQSSYVVASRHCQNAANI